MTFIIFWSCTSVETSGSTGSGDSNGKPRPLHNRQRQQWQRCIYLIAANCMDWSSVLEAEPVAKVTRSLASSLVPSSNSVHTRRGRALATVFDAGARLRAPQTLGRAPGVRRSDLETHDIAVNG